MSIFTGSGVAIVTPFLPDGSVNYEKLDELIEYHIAHKTDAIIICGTTGESSTLTEEEHMQCIKFTVEQAKKRIPVIAGTGSNATFTTIEMSREAVDYGCLLYTSRFFFILDFEVMSLRFLAAFFLP